MKEKVEEAEKELRDKFTHMLTQISVFSNLKLDNNGHSNGGGSNSSSSGAELDAWMGRVTGELKKKLDVYESLLGTLRGQLQDKREKELMSVGGGGAKGANSAKFASGEANGEMKNGNAESNGNGTAAL